MLQAEIWALGQTQLTREDYLWAYYKSLPRGGGFNFNLVCKRVYHPTSGSSRVLKTRGPPTQGGGV